MEIRGLDQLQRRLRELERNARALEGSNQVPISELLPDSFVSRHSRFPTASAMLTAGGAEDESDLASDAWDEFIRQETTFSGWEEMCQTAAAEWTQRKLGL
jgi:hypothetical protein